MRRCIAECAHPRRRIAPRLSPAISSLIVASSLGGWISTAFADDDPSAAFRAAVTKLAEAEHRSIESWWEANLDKDAQLERVAVLCDLEGAEQRGYFIVEKDASRRWEIPFSIDKGRTNACGGTAPAAQPTWERRTSTRIELRQNRRDGYSSTFFAIRGEQPCIVREEDVTTGKHKKTTVTDHEKSKSVLIPDGMQPLKR